MIEKVRKIMETNKSILLDSALDLVSFFNIFQDDMGDEIGRLAADLDRCIVKNNGVEIIHTGSGFEQLSLPHIENFMLWNTDADHMIIRTDVEVQQGTDAETVNSTQAENSAETNVNEADIKLTDANMNSVDMSAYEEDVNVESLKSLCGKEGIAERVDTDKTDFMFDNNNNMKVHKFAKSSVTSEKAEKRPSAISSDVNNNIQYVYEGSHSGYAIVSNGELSCPISTESIQEHCQRTSEFIKDCQALIPVSRSSVMALNDGKITGPSYSLCTSGGSFNISRDFVYGLKCNFWPLQAKEWIHRERLYAWPSKEVISASVNQGCHIVPVGSHNGHLKEFEWRFSFSAIELKLVQSMTETQKLAYSILKAIIKNEMKEKKMDVFKSYHLKTTLFWFLEKRDWKIWESQSLHANIIELLDFFIAFYADGDLPNYFIRKNNMIDHQATGDVLRACEVLRGVKSDFTMCLCRYIEANQALPVFFDVPLSQLLNDNSEKFLQICKYNFLVMALAYILMRLKKGQSAANECTSDGVVCKLVHKASRVSNLQNSASEESTLSTEAPTATSVLALIEQSIDNDKMKVTENSAVILAVFNLFLTFHPSALDKIGFPSNSLEFYQHLTRPEHMECLLWAGHLHEKHCDVIYDFVVKKWINGPHFHTEDEQALKLAKLLMVILGKPTKQASAVTGSLLRRRVEGERFILLRVLAEYLLHVHLESSYIAFQACAYLMDRPVISEIYGFVNWGSYQPTKVRAVELILSKHELQAQVSEKEFDRLVHMQHDLTQEISFLSN